MIIGGEEVRSKEKIESIDPSTGEVFCLAQKATAEHATAAIEAALRAKESWAASRPSPDRRSSATWSGSSTSGGTRSAPWPRIECGYIAPECSGSWAEMMDFIRFNPWYLLELCGLTLGDGPPRPT